MNVAAAAGAAVLAVAVSGSWVATGGANGSGSDGRGTSERVRPPAPAATTDLPAADRAVPAPAATQPRADDGPAVLRIPSIGVRSVHVFAYRGEPDDARGTRIQNRGVAASPRGPEGGVGPGQVGNHIVTGHRLSAGGPLRRLPELRPGDVVRVAWRDAVYVYEITGTLRVSFRDAASKALQAAPVPGQPGRTATRPMITLSTCATPEDHAAGTYWSDRFGNPEHRIAKVGVLVDVR